MAKAKGSSKNEEEVKQKLGDAVKAVIEQVHGKEKVLKKYKIRKSWQQKHDELIELSKTLEAEHKKIVKQMEDAQKEFWRLIEADVKYDKKAAKKQNRCLCFRKKEGVVLLVENKMPDEMSGIGAIIAKGKC